MATIYLSSTYADLKDHREVVYRALRRLGHDVRAMEDYVAADERPLVKCLADVAACDIYVGILAWRYGFVPREDNPDGRSITELEYRRAGETGKPRLIFLLEEEAAWPRKFVDKGGAADRIEALREALSDQLVRSSFSTKHELAELVATAVTNELGTAEAVEAGSSAGVPSGYLDWVKKTCGSIELLGLRLKQGLSVRIGSVYVPLAAHSFFGLASPPRTKLSEPTSLLSLIDSQSLFLFGSPGSGKSTFCRWVAWLLAEGALPERDYASLNGAEAEGAREQFPEALRGKLPVLIRLRDFQRRLPPDSALTAFQLNRALKRWLTEQQPGGLTWPVLEARLMHGEALLLFDGVDEMSPSARAALLSALTVAFPVWRTQGNRVLLGIVPESVDLLKK